ncbi:Tissue inhibitor of metalloproteases-like Protein [Tribolium castaneum]|uniref:Tissue inhibitor of metalloproteases-like Protein n=1 Tax=Tribolium castaneum TaxID=7070 RepID=D7EHT4_TRICA|nr:Tissue inhibitor of metalloproteases-like Protein [Tribolium castaneum]
MRSNVLILTLAVTVAYLQYSNACSCMGYHPQTQYCRADFVILARVKRSTVLNSLKVYKVRIRKTYKGSDKATVALKSGRLLTASDEAMCGANLEAGRVYAISGQVNSLKAHINLCGMAIPWRNLTRRQRKGLKSVYKKGCDCRIEYCAGRKCHKTPDTCLLTNRFCHPKQAICLRQKSRKCMWGRNDDLKKCLLPFLGGSDRRSVR